MATATATANLSPSPSPKSKSISKPSAMPNTTTKSKRVRTGCLTCRERHLKCDESLPNCINCRKGSRPCKRGIRLNFLDTQVHAPAHTPRSHSYTVEFQDESRHIASEYRGGLQRYAVAGAVQHQQMYNKCAPLPISPPEEQSDQAPMMLGDSPGLSLKYVREMSSPSSMAKSYPESRLSSPNQVRTVGWTDSTEDSNYAIFANGPATGTGSTSYAHYSYLAWQQYGSPRPMKRTGETVPLFVAAAAAAVRGPKQLPARHPNVRDPRASYNQANNMKAVEGYGYGVHVAGEDDGTLPLFTRPATGEREFLRTADEVRYLQVFVEDVAVWMDSFDKDKHFGHVVPYRALKSPMLLNSLLACGARRLCKDPSSSTVDPSRDPSKDAEAVHTAQFYYNTATTQLLRTLENPERDTAECAAAAVLLKVCDLMAPPKRNGRRMSHVPGFRARMIRDCGWNANSGGLGLACFWLNIYMEVLSSLESDCAVSVPPNEWGLDLRWMEDDGDEDDGDHENGDGEERWIQRMIYILARVADFQAFASMFRGHELSGEKMRLEYRLPEWRSLKHLCDRWNDKCPRTMHPLGYLNRGQTSSSSLFPKVWLPKREAVLGRLLYHTAQCILTQNNPMEQDVATEEMRALQIHHAHEVCGIVAHAEEAKGGSGTSGSTGGASLAFLAVRALIIAARVLVDQGEQTEVLHMLRRVQGEGVPLRDVERELKKSWGWQQDNILGMPVLDEFPVEKPIAWYAPLYSYP